MKNIIKKRLLATVVALALPQVSVAQDYPSKPITMIVPYGTGGVSDTTSRMISDVLSQELGQSVIVENKPGAQGVVGAKIASNADADGYTAVVMTNSLFSIEFLEKPQNNLSVDDFEAICISVRYPSAVLVNADLPYRTFEDLYEAAKNGTEKIRYGFISSVMKLNAEQIFGPVDDDLMGVPYKGMSDALTDLAAGRITLQINDLKSAMPMIETGRVRALLMTSKDRYPIWPDIPSTTDVGLSDIDIYSTVGIFVPKGTDPAAKAKFTQALEKTLKDDGLKTRLAEYGLQINGACGDAADKIVTEDVAFWQNQIATK